LQVTPSPIIELNRAVAVSMASGPAAGLELVDELLSERSLQGYHLLPSVRGDLLAKLGRLEEARTEFERAASLTKNARERALLLGADDRPVGPKAAVLQRLAHCSEPRNVAADEDLARLVPVHQGPLRAVQQSIASKPLGNASGDCPFTSHASQIGLEPAARLFRFLERAPGLVGDRLHAGIDEGGYTRPRHLQIAAIAK